SPYVVVSDGFNYVMISDTKNNRVLIYQGIPNTNNQFPNSVVGQTAFVQDLAGSGTQHMNFPEGLNYQDGYIYVADTGNNRVLVYPDSPVAVTITGQAAGYLFGQDDFAHTAANDLDQNGQPGNQSDNHDNTLPAFNVLNAPTGMYNDNAGHTYVTDTGNQ